MQVLCCKKIVIQMASVECKHLFQTMAFVSDMRSVTHHKQQLALNVYVASPDKAVKQI